MPSPRLAVLLLEARLTPAYYLPAGPAVQVNTAVAGIQRDVALAADPAGRLTVAWADDSLDGQGYGVYARRLAPDLTPAGDPFPVATGPDDQDRPVVGVNDAGQTVIAYRERRPNDNPEYPSIFSNVRARAFDPAGVPVGHSADVYTYDGDYVNRIEDRTPAVAVGPTGDFRVLAQVSGTVYRTTLQVTGFTAAGEPTGQTTVTYPDGGDIPANQYVQAVRFAPDGSALLVTAGIETTLTPYDSFYLYHRAAVTRVSPTGQVLSTVPLYDLGTNQEYLRVLAVAVTPLADGGFLATYQAPGGSPSAYQPADGFLTDDPTTELGILGRRFAADGTPVGGPVLLVPPPTDYELFGRDVRLATLSDGNVAVTWVEHTPNYLGEENTPDQGYVRVFTPDGTPLSPAIAVVGAAARDQAPLEVAADPDGGFVLAWGDPADGFLVVFGDTEVMAAHYRRFDTLPNTPPTLDPVADVTVPAGGTANVPLAVGDAETPAGELAVSAAADDAALVPAGGLVVGGTGAALTLTVTPAAGRSGTTAVTVTVTDGAGGTVSRQFRVTVSPPPPANTGPTLDPLPDLALRVGASVAVALRLADTETSADQLQVTTARSDPAAVAVEVTGSGAARTLTVSPTAAGSADVTVTATDAGGLTASRRFRVTATAPISPPPPPVTTAAPGFAVGGVGGSVQTVRPTGTGTVTPPGLTGAVRTATADFTGDGVADTVAGAGPGGVSRVVLLDGASGRTLLDLSPFESTFFGGVFVAAGDLDGDGRAEIVVTPDQGGGPVAVVYRADGTQLVRFFGIEDPGFRGGARPAVGDVNGDGRADLLVAAGFGGGPRLAVFDGRSVLGGGLPPKLVPDFFVFEPTLRNGVFVASGDLTGDGAAEVVVGGGPGGGPRVFALDGRALVAGRQTPVANFFAGDPASRGGVRLAVRPDATGQPQLVTGSGEGEAARVRVYSPAAARAGTAAEQDLAPFGGAVLGDGVYVG